MTKIDPAKLLEEYAKKGYNILTPSITLEGLSPHHHATVETVVLSPKLDIGDVYPHQKEKDQTKVEARKFRIAKQGLDKLAVLAGIIWHEQGGSRRVDNAADRNYVAFEAFGAIRKADGQLVPVKAFYDLDFIAIEEDLVVQYAQKNDGQKKKEWRKEGEERQEYIDFCVGRDMRSKRKHRSTLCESGARNRVIRALLGIKKVYTGAELSKPFVCIRITYQPDYNDPEVKRILTLASIGAQAAVYGLPTQAKLPPPDQAEYHTLEEGETIDAEDVETEPNGVDDEEEPGDDNDFENWDRFSQLTHIGVLATQKAYDLKDLLKRMDKSLDEFSGPQLQSLHDKLNDMDDDDIPF